jgi:predicted RNA binding protein YcfA (HicA-like mRNA interferase family)
MRHTFKAVKKRLLKDGWELDHIKGSHNHFKHPEKGTITVPGNPGKEIKTKTYRRIAKAAGWL